MTKDEFKAEESVLLNRIPPEFRHFIGRYAWEEGHANGYNEVLIHLDELVDGVEDAVEAYTKRLKEELP